MPVGVEQIVKRIFKQFGQITMRHLAVIQPREQADQPGEAPAHRVFPFVLQPKVDRYPASVSKLGGASMVELAARMQRIEMGHMPVPGLRFFEIREPLLQLSAAADLEWAKARPCSGQFKAQLPIDPQVVGRFHAVSKELAEQGNIHRGVHADGRFTSVRQGECILRRGGRIGN